MNCTSCNTPHELIDGLCHRCTAISLAQANSEIKRLDEGWHNANQRALMKGLEHQATLAACAAMRAALDLIKQERKEQLKCGPTGQFFYSVKIACAVNDALTSTAGQGWASPAEVEELKAQRNAAAVKARHEPLKRVAELAAELDQLQAQVAELTAQLK